MSIHKSQGQTLQYVKIDLAKAFESGAFYSLEFLRCGALIIVDPKANVTLHCRERPRWRVYRSSISIQ